MTNIGTDKETSELVIKQALAFDGVYAAIGLYPEFCNDNEVDYSFIEKLLCDKVVAIGEIGLDYHGEDVNKENQKKHFIILLPQKIKCIYLMFLKFYLKYL